MAKEEIIESSRNKLFTAFSENMKVAFPLEGISNKNILDKLIFSTWDALSSFSRMEGINIDEVKKNIFSVIRKFDFAYKQVSSSRMDIFFLGEFLEHFFNLAGNELFNKDISVSSTGKRILTTITEKMSQNFQEGARALAEAQREAKEMFVGPDIPIEILGFFETNLVNFPPGRVLQVRAIIPPGYFRSCFRQSLDSDKAVVEALRKNKITALTFLNQPVQKSRLGQMGIEIFMPSFDINSVQITDKGEIIADMLMINRSPFQTFNFNKNDVLPAFRLFLESARKRLIGEDLINEAKHIIGDTFDPNVHIMCIGGIPIGLKLPVVLYAIQDPLKNSEVDISNLLRTENLPRAKLDKELGINGWMTDPRFIKSLRKNSTVLGETQNVCFSKYTTGVISQWILVETGKSKSFIARHGNSRVIDPLFNLPIRTEFQNNGKVGDEYLVVFLYSSRDDVSQSFTDIK